MLRIVLFGILLMLSACGPRVFLRKEIARAEEELHEHAGFMLYDPQTRKSIFEYKSSRYFTPASNTKIFTFYTALKVLGDSVPALKYAVTADSLIFWGLGDPSFLNKNVFQNNRVFAFLSDSDRPLYFSSANFSTDAFGAGWAWDDYNYSYSAERSPFPVYGNCLSAQLRGDTLTLTPGYFENLLVTSPQKKSEPALIRAYDTNQLTFYESDSAWNKQWDIPFRTRDETIAALLSDTLKRKVTTVHKPLRTTAMTVKSIPVDSLLRVMMQDSDNFIAEQILLMSAALVSDSLKTEIAIRHMIRNHLNDLPDSIIWVDGSGLSRYNLFTPRSVVSVWEKIDKLIARDRLFALLATGGKSGTLRNGYNAEVPYIFGKTGTLSNNHSLSGYLVTRKGRTFLFSFMNANYVAATSAVRKKMEAILKTIHDRY